MVNIEELKKILQEKFPDSKISLEDTIGDGHHFELAIISDLFQNKSLVQRQQMVYETLGSIVGKEIHALTLETKTFNESKGISDIEYKVTNNTNISLDTDILKKIDQAIKSYDVILFMKGTKSMPMCGFSSVVVSILNNLKIEYTDINVLDSDEIRENIKIYSNWSTIPQLYVKGNFIGGADILREMYENKSLEALFKKHKLI